MRTFVYFAPTCPTCCRAPAAPYRVYDEHGKAVSGCVDHFHTGHLVAGTESSRWHNRPEAKKLRANSKAMRQGWVTEYRAEAA